MHKNVFACIEMHIYTCMNKFTNILTCFFEEKANEPPCNRIVSKEKSTQQLLFIQNTLYLIKITLTTITVWLLASTTNFTCIDLFFLYTEIPVNTKIHANIHRFLQPLFQTDFSRKKKNDKNTTIKYHIV